LQRPFGKLNAWTCFKEWLYPSIWLVENAKLRSTKHLAIHFQNRFPYQIFSFWRFQSIHPHFHAYNDKSSRQQLFEISLDSILKSAPADCNPSFTLSYAREVFQGWFFGQSIENIRYDNVAMWLAWAFFDRNIHELDTLELMELHDMVITLEKFLLVKFQKGINPNLKCIRLTLDPVQASSRPLIYYGIISLFRTLAHMTLSQMGFSMRTVIVNNEDGSPISQQFFYRAASTISATNAKPIVFIHGSFFIFLFFY